MNVKNNFTTAIVAACNLSSRLNSATPISYMVWIFWRSVNWTFINVTLTCDLTLNICNVPDVTWSDSTPNFSEIEQSAVELQRYKDW